MIHRPRFKSCFHCEVVPSEGVFLLSEREYFLLRGTAYLLLAPLLTGQYTTEEIIELLHHQISPPELFYALELLQRKGYVVEANTFVPPEQAAFWDMLGVESEVGASRLQETTVSVVSFGQIDSTPFRTMLESLGVNVGQEGERWVALTDDYLQDGLEAFNQQALIHHRAWLLVKPVGTELWIGPVFIPGQTGCWACLAHRLRGHRKIEGYLQAKHGTSSVFPTSLSVLPSTLHTALGIAATETAKWMVSGHNKQLEGTIVTLNTLSLEKRNHVLIRRPQCPCCGGQAGTSAKQQAIPFMLQSRRKVFTSDGGHRTFPPEEIFKRLEHHISPITGIVSDLRRISTWEDENGLTPSYIADYNFLHRNDDLSILHAALRSRSGGKGRHDIQAKVSALGESIERYSGRFQGDEPRIRATFKDLGAAAIHPNTCMLFSEQQFARREQWNLNGSRFNRIPEPFDETREIEWSPVWSLTYQEPRYLPTAYCYHGYAQQYHVGFAYADGNGCAAGSNKEEAVLQGFMELVERDSVALWWYNRLSKPAVNLASFNEPYFQQLSTYYQTLRRDLWVLDITSDLGIPAFAAISRRNDKPIEDIILGFGAHFDPRIAILRALTELNQSLPAVFSVTADKGDEYLDRNHEAIEWWQHATIKNQAYLSPNMNLASKIQADYPQVWSDDLYTDVQKCVQVVQAKGIETLVLDQTRPDTGLHVVKVIAPGLRHFWARFGPGRLYDVPVQTGWLTEPLTEEQLNPQFIYF